MTGPDAIGSAEPNGPSKPRWKLWHLMGIVFATSMALGVVREITGFEHRRTVDLGLGLLGVLAGSGWFVAFLVATGLGFKLGNRLALGLLRWGERRGGLREWFAILFGMILFLGGGAMGMGLGWLLLIGSIRLLGRLPRG